MYMRYDRALTYSPKQFNKILKILQINELIAFILICLFGKRTV